MSSPDWPEIEKLFFGALEVPEGERHGWLTQAANGQSDLAEEVRSLLDAHAGSEAAAGPRRIGPYRLERRIGRGGMGDVWLASRADGAYDQRVAVKLVRTGLGVDALLVRFRRERQMLARLNHPSIARLLDGGIAPDGRPYLVMEYVEGEPLLDFCEHNGLDLRARLTLFRQLCAAVAYAHQNLIVHRDLKPANVLVTADGQPKLLDFGIAKLAESDEAATVTAMPMLTPRYASPEQLRGEEVTTASDIYSLGVLLFELLTGSLPYELGTGTAPELISAIATQEPRTASRVARVPAGDLDAIIGKALEKDPARRYPSVERLAADIGNYLDGLPVSARTPTFAYRAGRFVKRHRLAVVFGSLMVLIIMTAIATVLWQARRAERESRQNAQLSGFLQSILGMSSDRDLSPLRENFRTTRMIDVIRYGATRLDVAMAGQPAAQARLSALFSIALSENADYEEADRVARRGVELVDRKKDPQLAALVLYALGRSHLFQGMLREAYAELAEAVSLMDAPSAERRVLDKSYLLAHFLWASLMLNGGRRTPALDQMLDRALAEARAEGGESSPMYASVLATEGIRYLDENRISDAEAAVDRAVSIQKSLPVLPEEYNWTLNALAYLRRQQGRLDEALELKSQECAAAESVYGRANTLFQTCRMELGNWQSRKGDMAATVRILGEVSSEVPQALPKALWLDAWVLFYRSQALIKLGRIDQAKADLHSCYSLTRDYWGESSDFTKAVAKTLAQVRAVK